MGRTHREILASLSDDRRSKIELRSAILKLHLSNEVFKDLIEAIDQRVDPKLRDKARKIIAEQIDELMAMNDAGGPATDSEDGILLELLNQLIERSEDDA